MKEIIFCLFIFCQHKRWLQIQRPWSWKCWELSEDLKHEGYIISVNLKKRGLVFFLFSFFLCLFIVSFFIFWCYVLWLCMDAIVWRTRMSPVLTSSQFPVFAKIAHKGDDVCGRWIINQQICWWLVLPMTCQRPPTMQLYSPPVSEWKCLELWDQHTSTSTTTTVTTDRVLSDPPGIHRQHKCPRIYIIHPFQDDRKSSYIMKLVDTQSYHNC